MRPHFKPNGISREGRDRIYITIPRTPIISLNFYLSWSFGKINYFSPYYDVTKDDYAIDIVFSSLAIEKENLAQHYSY